MGRLTEYRDPDLTEILITQSFDAGLFLRVTGVGQGVSNSDRDTAP
jgi:hypothetical protein